MTDRTTESTETGQSAGPIDEATTEGTTDPAARASRTRLLTLIVLLVMLVAGVAIAVIANTGTPTDPTVAPQGWQQPDVDAATTIDLGQGDYSGHVVIAADEKTCWNGYIGDQPLKGCGNRYYNVENAEQLLGLNAKSLETRRAFLGIAVWDGDVERIIESAETRKKAGAVAVSAGLQTEG